MRRARFVEWWAHARPHCYGHQTHFDSVPGARVGRPRHPIVSTITFLSAEVAAASLSRGRDALKDWWIVPTKK